MGLGCSIYFSVVLPCLLFTISLSCFFGFYFGLVWPEVEETEDYVQSVCAFTNLTTVAFRCCDIVDCLCEECYLYEDCKTLQEQLVEGFCCGDYRCCSTCCDTCTSCNSDGTSCTSYSCNCYCCVSVSSDSCRTACGTCHSFTAKGEFDTKGSPPRETIEFVRTDSCGRDNFVCKADKVKYYSGETECWYQKSNPEGSLRFDDPYDVPDGHWALVGLSAGGMLFSLLLGLLLCFTLFLVPRIKHNCT
ncbi:hypothetical protein QOT17_019584 [Balamuthia mandrillaris]